MRHAGLFLLFHGLNNPNRDFAEFASKAPPKNVDKCHGGQFVSRSRVYCILCISRVPRLLGPGVHVPTEIHQGCLPSLRKLILDSRNQE